MMVARGRRLTGASGDNVRRADGLDGVVKDRAVARRQVALHHRPDPQVLVLAAVCAVEAEVGQVRIVLAHGQGVAAPGQCRDDKD